MNLFKTIALSICLGAGSTFCIDAATTTPLLDSLRNAVDSGRFYFGHHDDTAYGHEREYTDDASDVFDLTGKLPGMMSWDLGDIEHGVDRNLDGVPFKFIASEVRRQHERGGLTTISWHPDNPVSGGDSWDVSTAPVSLMQSDKAVRDSIAACINRVADFIGDLRDAEGNRIPVIFRPWHENTGSWFWWGAAHCTPEQYIDLWRLTRRCFDEKGLDNVVWAYSPDKDLTPEKYLLTYPGDEYVDILACDIYHFNGEEGLDEYLRRADIQFAFITRMAQERGKIAAFAETGLESLTIPDWYTRVLLPLMKRYPLAYVCVWRNANERVLPNHYYVPFRGHPAAPDFQTFAADPAVILLDP